MNDTLIIIIVNNVVFILINIKIEMEIHKKVSLNRLELQSSGLPFVIRIKVSINPIGLKIDLDIKTNQTLCHIDKQLWVND